MVLLAVTVQQLQQLGHLLGFWGTQHLAADRGLPVQQSTVIASSGLQQYLPFSLFLTLSLALCEPGGLPDV